MKKHKLVIVHEKVPYKIKQHNYSKLFIPIVLIINQANKKRNTKPDIPML
jgi:hypothetical protein